ncbi:hypothetical protein A9Q84_10750 [Halobacteriovorax marinus]|mgnify:CR=1 FL=1|uniref:HTH hxlR-type domain-containing protein n=1 Tax=Halobacteriovorax marinus TaxID=97084 RepID=A0A1Y5FBH6_9BACT|nr:hypothetical protein A9Q84_10750 [Halobacteriovorax marinus]
MVTRTEHRDRSGCPVACALDIFGDHWSLLVIRNLMFTDLHEYKDMLKSEEKISTNILTARLKLLEGEGLISSTPHKESQRRKLYYLTQKGKDLVHIMTSIVFWSQKHLYEFLDIPNEKEEFLKLGPEVFVQKTLEKLEQWEKENIT